MSPASPDLQKKIVIIEGDTAFGQQVADGLSAKGYRALLTKDPVEGLKMIFDNLPHLVMIDADLANDAAYEVISKKNGESLLRTIPVFLLSTQGKPINTGKVPQGSVAEFVISFHTNAAEVIAKAESYFNKTGSQGGTAATVAPSGEGKVKLLWVEDDKLIGTILAKKLISSGFDLTHAKNGEEALAALKTMRPDVIVLDLLLPGMSGFDILQRIDMEPSLKGIPAMILSNLSKQSDIEKAKVLGAKKFLVKAAASLDQIVDEIKGLVK